MSMRWKKRIRPVPGDRKFARKFLWFPVSRGGETRWLEFAYVEYWYRRNDRYEWWDIKRFITEEEWRIEMNTWTIKD